MKTFQTFRNRPATLAAVVAIAGAVTFYAPAPATASATASPLTPPSTSAPSSQNSITLSGSVTDARSEHITHGVISVPASAPPVRAALIQVDGHTVARTNTSGAFSFVYQDPNRRAVTITVSAPGFGSYRERGVTPPESGDTLTVQLTGKSQSIDAQAPPAAAPAEHAAKLSPATSSSNCGGYSSDTTAPSTILVLEYSEHTANGAPVAGTQTGIFSVPFETYVEDVLPNEWITSWDPASLKAGAMAVKTYAWNWVNNWRGGSYNGSCFNVDDSTDYQRYIPGQSAAATNTAIADTWDETMTDGGSIFSAAFQRTLTGSESEACGSGLSDYPDTLSQWGSENCAVDGDSWQTILSTYYPGIALTGETHSPVSMNAAGTDVAFVNASGQVSHDWGTASGWAGPAAIGGSARADSPVVENSAGTLVAFIDTSGQVVNDWANTTGWHGPAAIGGTAKPGSALAINAAGNDVTFINTSGQVSHDWGTSTGWAGPAAIGGTARADSPLVDDDNDDTVIFINTSGQVVNDWATSNGWAGPAAIGGTAQADSPLATDDSGRDVVFLNTSGQVVNDWGNANGWNGPAAIGGTAEPGTAMAEDGTGADVVFTNTAGALVNDWGTTNGWAGPAAIGGTPKTGSGIAQSDDSHTVAYINTNGQVVNDWSNSTGWHGPAAIGGTSR